MKANFFYANGTTYLFNLMEVGFSFQTQMGEVRIGGNLVGSPNTSRASVLCPGIGGRNVLWNQAVENDPFPFMLNPDVWNASKISYPASILGGGDSVNYGIAQTIKLIQATPSGQPFAIGGYSQGAAVMSEVYNQIKSPSGSLYSRRKDFLGGTVFGNPRRQVNFRGEVGGTWSGGWDVPGSTTGGHGCYPTNGSWPRLSGCDPTKWIDMAAPNDMFAAVTDSTANGVNWVKMTDVLMNLASSQYFGALLLEVPGDFVSLLTGGKLTIDGPMATAAKAGMAVAGSVNNFIDAVGKVFTTDGGGHSTYPWKPCANANGTYPSSGDTYYQTALKWLEAKAQAWATAPVLIASNSTGWSTTLVPPSS